MAELAGKGERSRNATASPAATCEHTQMLGLEHHGGATGTHTRRQGLGDLFPELLLHLEPSRQREHELLDT